MDFESVHRRLLDRDPEARAKTVRELGQTGERSVLPFVYGALEDRTPEVRHAANEALMTLRLGVGVLTAIDRAADPDPDERRSALALLREHPDSRARDRLHVIASDDDEESDIRVLAIRAIAEIGAPQSLELLLDTLDDDVCEVRGAAVRALERMQFEVEPGPQGHVEAIAKIAQYMFDDCDAPDDHAAAARALGTCDWPSALNHLAEAMKDARPEVREAAARAAAGRKDAKKHEGIREALEERRSAERQPRVRAALDELHEKLGGS